jgi:hypothetical protein
VRISRETWIGVGAFALATAAMAVDHLVGTDPENEDSFPVDPAAFFVSVGLSALLVAFLFAWVVPRAKARRDDAARTAVQAAVCSGLAVVPGIAFLWLGFPLVLAGGGIALGLLGRRSERRRLATAAVVVGAIVVVFGAGAYTFAFVRDL